MSNGVLLERQNKAIIIIIIIIIIGESVVCVELSRHPAVAVLPKQGPLGYGPPFPLGTIRG